MSDETLGEAQFREQVLPVEREVIARRRAFWGLPAAHAPRPQSPDVPAALVRGPVGLALSGGGIRSATFSLGILQVFAKKGLLKWVDYLSTVSGGGYIGSCLSALLHFEETGRGRPGGDLIHQGGMAESPVLKHLRSGGNYLAPHGLLDALRIPAVLLRGILLNLLMLAPITGLVALLTAWQYPTLAEVDLTVNFFLTDPTLPRSAQLVFFVWVPWVLALFGVWVLLFPVAATLAPHASFRVRSAYEKSFAILLLATVVVPIVELGPVIFHGLEHLEADLDGLTGALSAAVTALVFVARSFDQSLRHPSGGAAEGSVAPGIAAKVKLLGIGILGPGSLLLLYLVMLHWIYKPYEDVAVNVQGFHGRMTELAFVIAGVYVFTRLLININKTGIHNFYRDRLSAAYLFNPRTLKHEDSLKLSQLASETDGSPYQLINAALNVPGTRDRNLQGRATDFFLFSPKFCGSFLTGYCKTPVLEHVDGHLNLGTAFAISGAAASPYMGTHTPKLLVFLLTILNVRLDYWISNPSRYLDGNTGLTMGSCRVGPSYLISELLGWLTAKSRYVNLSDGGHIENLGLYELLRRRCRYIVCCDGEEDGALNLPSLGQLTAYARMDDGIWITWVNLSLLKKDEQGYSQAQWFYGTIDYGESEGSGQIIYIKSSLSGREPEDVATYHAAHPNFPHQPTLDQFFDELQFESYRALGYFIADQLFDAKTNDIADIEEFFEARKKEAQRALVNATAMRSVLEVA